MYCKDCIQINPLPKCVEPGGSIVLTGISFPDNVSETMWAVMFNLSSDYSLMFEFTTDGMGEIIDTDGNPTTGLDITSAYDLMNHSYQIEFLTKPGLEPVTASVDGQLGCCVKFKVMNGLVGDGEIPLTTGTCA